jgi:glycosyltransferase involved in cell wall biosynthesis
MSHSGRPGLVVGMDAFPLRRFASGTEEYIEGLTRALLAGPVDVRPLGAPVTSFRPDLPRLGLPERAGAKPWSKWWWEMRGLPAAARRMTADVVHIPYMAHPAQPMGRPTVVTVHDVIPFTFPGYVRRLRDQVYFRGLPTRLSRADRLVAVSEATRTAVAATFPDWIPRLVVIENGVDDSWFEPPEPGSLAEARRLLGWAAAEGPPYVLYAGNYQAHKNVAVLLSAMGGVRPAEARLVLVGAAGRAEVAAAVDAAGIGARASLLPRVKRPVLRALYALATVYAYPSTVEGFGLPPAQALAAGVPVVVSDADALVEVVGDAGRVVPRDDFGGWTEALSHALALPQAARAATIATGRQRAERFRWGVAAQRYTDLYREVAR